MRRWVVLFSQTGKEISDLSECLNRRPDLVLYNNEGVENVDERLSRYVTNISRVPSIEEYRCYLKKDDIITLHGYLRIIPAEICDEFEIYNGHPGLITEYAFLKGKDPQEKAFDMKLDSSGCVIHKVVAGVDEGEVIKSRKVRIKDFNLDRVFLILKKTSLDLWIDFLKEKLLC